MTKKKTKTNQKRKRVEKSGPSSHCEDPKLNRGHKNQSAEKLEDIEVDKDVSSVRNKKERKTKKTNKRDDKKEMPIDREDDGYKSDIKVGIIEPTGKSTSAVQQRQSERFSKKSMRESERLPKKRKKEKRSQKDLPSSFSSFNHRNYDEDDDEEASQKDFDEEKITNEKIDDEVVLEGSIVSDILLLIDRKAGRVYSAIEERLQNGERKQVGRLDGNGQVVFFHKTVEKGNDTQSFSINTSGNDNNGDDKTSSVFPYEVDPDDHCESPLEAYRDIVPLLESYRRWIQKQSNSQLSIYDPYFCNGRVVRHLESLGFPDVYNRKEDCYKIWKDASLYPSYDVFLTNPPYSADHIEKLMQHVTSKQNKNKPWMLLMPNFVHKKDYFKQLTADNGQLPIYLVPKKRYIYQPPQNMRAKKASSTHKKSSPFVSMWYLWGGSREVTDEWYRLMQKQYSTAFDVARSKSALRDLRRKPKKR